jgi:hypothetical protein
MYRYGICRYFSFVLIIRVPGTGTTYLIHSCDVWEIEKKISVGFPFTSDPRSCSVLLEEGLYEKSQPDLFLIRLISSVADLIRYFVVPLMLQNSVLYIL